MPVDAAPEEDMNIYFDRASLLEHLGNLEEDNLFKIHLVQEDEQELEVLRQDIEETLAGKEREIDDVRMNIEMLEHSKAVLVSKQNFLESNMKVKQSGAKTTTPALIENRLDEKSALIMLQ